MFVARNQFAVARPLSAGLNCFLILLALVRFTGRSEVSTNAPEDDINWAKERQFWAFHTPQAPPRPVVKNQRWPSQPLDYFIAAKLEQRNLQPSPQADRQPLIRRLTFDLTGLPPAPEEVRDFVADRGADAYARLVDRLLSSPRFGEHLASLWLPLARYAEDQAHQVGSDTKFFYPNAFLYRQWVIDAFNHDLPYDQFLKFQLAADKIAGGEQNLAALGFLGLGPKYYDRGRLSVMADEWEDRVDTVSRTMLGLTVACARCHDHKFDPVTTRDYYAMAGVFASTKMMNRGVDGKPEKDVTADKMDPKTLHMVEDGEGKDINVFLRGNPDRKGALVERRFLKILSDDEPRPFKEGSGRKELAEAIACRNNPLAARVMVNRVWGAFFGKPIVATPSNFGHSGQPPSNPELLDALALRFMAQGWSVKTLVREIVLSSTYRQTSLSTKRHDALDPENELLGHMNRRRLSIEQWRDAVLYTSGTLDLQGGKSLELDDTTNTHRTVFARVSRLKLNDIFMQFDYPDANVHAEKRATTSTPLQKLFLLNNPFMLTQAKALSSRVAAESGEKGETRVATVYRLLFGREPKPSELAVATQFLARPNPSSLPRWQQYAQALLISNEMWYVD